MRATRASLVSQKEDEVVWEAKESSILETVNERVLGLPSTRRLQLASYKTFVYFVRFPPQYYFYFE